MDDELLASANSCYCFATIYELFVRERRRGFVRCVHASLRRSIVASHARLDLVIANSLVTMFGILVASTHSTAMMRRIDLQFPSNLIMQLFRPFPLFKHQSISSRHCCLIRCRHGRKSSGSRRKISPALVKLQRFPQILG